MPNAMQHYKGASATIQKENLLFDDGKEVSRATP